MRPAALLFRVLLALAFLVQGLPTAMAAHGEAVPAAMTDAAGGCHEHAAPADDAPAPAPVAADCCGDGDCSCACAVPPLVFTIDTQAPLAIAPALAPRTKATAGHHAPALPHRLRPPIARA
jgi:hypothetical protein